MNGYELIIESSNENNAQKAFDLFIAALTLRDSHCVFPIYDLPAVFDYSFKKLPPKDIHSFCQSGIYNAACIAKKASFRKMYVNLLYKYLFACTQHSNYIVDLDPSHGEYHKLNRNPADCLRYSYAIIAHYSIIEELGLEIRASNKNPSKINNQWNQLVKKDLEKRLINSKINLNVKAYWNLRSRPTKIHLRDKLI
jgi:hypothetical protein